MKRTSIPFIRAVNTGEIEGPSVSRQDRGLPLRASDPGHAYWPDVGRAELPSPAASVDVRVRVRV